MAKFLDDAMLKRLSLATGCTVDQLQAAFDLYRIWNRRLNSKKEGV